MNAIIKFFKSIIGFITGLFGGKKGKDGFFMEAAPAETAPAAAEVAAETATTPAEATANRKPQNGKVPTGKTAGKAAAAGAVAAAATLTATPKVLDSGEIIRMALASSQQTPEQQQIQAEANASFAEMNAVPVATTGRRRPGVNMTGFLDMAKTMRTGR